MDITKGNLVVIGAGGYWGSIIVRAAIEVLGVDHVLAVDVSETGLKLLAEHLTAQHGIDGDPMLAMSASLDTVLENENNKYFVIATPPQSHYKIAIKLLNHKRNILITKPIALSAKDAEDISALAASRRVVATVDHTFLFHPAVTAMIKAVKSGAIGSPKTFYADWLSRGKIQDDVDVIWDLAPHPLSILLEFWKFPIEVSCKVLDKNNGVPTEASLFLIEQCTGNSATIHVSWMDSNKSRTFKIRGSHHTIIFDDMEGVDGKLRIKGGKTTGHQLLSEGYAGKVYDLTYTHEQVIKLNWEEPLKQELRNFIKTVEQPFVNSDEVATGTMTKGIACVKLIEAAERSLQKGVTEIVV